MKKRTNMKTLELRAGDVVETTHPVWRENIGGPGIVLEKRKQISAAGLRMRYHVFWVPLRSVSVFDGEDLIKLI